MNHVEILNERIKILEERINQLELRWEARGLIELKHLISNHSQMIALRSITESKKLFSAEADGSRFRRLIKESTGVEMSSKYDLIELIQGEKKCPNRVEKLKYWIGIKKKMDDEGVGESIGVISPTHAFVDQVINYYQNSVIEYILNKGKHLDKGGRRPDIDKNEVIEKFNNYKTDPNLKHQSGRYMGKPKREKIYEKIADDLKLSENHSDRTKRIRDIVKEWENKP